MSTYYIKAAGDATKDGLSDINAWPISKVSTFAFSPGDQILFKKGDVFGSNVSLSVSGTSGNIIQLDAYGAGSNPILDGGASGNSILTINGKAFVSIKNLILQNCKNPNALLYLNGNHDIVIQNCYFNNGVRGILINNTTGNISITACYFTKITDPNITTNGGGSKVQVTNSTLSVGSVNIDNNFLYESTPNNGIGDQISFYKAYGTSSFVYTANGNRIRGGGSTPVPNGFCGINLGDNDGSHQISNNNIIIAGGANGMQMTGGNFCQMSNNSIYSAQNAYSKVGILYGAYIGSAPATVVTISNNILCWRDHTGAIDNAFWDTSTQPVQPTGWTTNGTPGVCNTGANNAMLADPLFDTNNTTGPWNSATTALVFNAIPAKVYGNANFDPGATSGNAITYTSSNTAVATIISGLIHIVGAGTSTITANDGSTTQTQTLTVNKAVITVNIANKSKNYGASNPGLTSSYSGFVNGDTSSVITSSPTLSTTGLSSSPVGTYPIIGSGGAAANYSFTFINGTLTINKVSLSITANNATRVFGAANPTFTVAYAGFVNGDTTVATPPTINSFTNNVTPVGTYSIVPSAAADPNYNITYVNGTLTIMKAPLTITADNQSKNYLAPNPNLTVSYSGFLNGDTANSLTTKPSLSTTANSSSVVGTYPIVPSGAVATNYYFIYVNGVLTITSVALTFNPFTPVTYGVPDLNPGAISTAPITYTSSNTAVATIVGNKIHVVGAGSTTITANNGSTALPQTLTVNPANLIILADNHAIFLGDSIPTLTASYMGFVNGDTSASLSSPAILTTSATSGSPVGLYPIVPSGAVDGNYNISYSDGTLSIIPVGTVHFNCPVAIKP